MKKLIFVALLFSTAAHAECVQWGRDQFNNRICMADDLVNRNFVMPEVNSVTGGSSGVTISAVPTPQCDEGWRLVDVATGHPMCAKELREPH